MAGTKEFEEVVEFGMGLGKALGKALEDGHFSFSDALIILPALMKANAAVEGISMVPSEMKDLDEAEYKRLTDYFKAEFDLPNDKVEEMIETAYDVALKVIQIAASFTK